MVSNSPLINTAMMFNRGLHLSKQQHHVHNIGLRRLTTTSSTSTSTTSSTTTTTTTTTQDSTAPFVFDFPKIRQEIAHIWCRAQSQHIKETHFLSNRGVPSSLSSCTNHHEVLQSYQDPRAPWHWMDRELSSNMAGETGAVYIYRGALAAIHIRTSTSGLTTDASSAEAAKRFAQQHMHTEATHLRYFQLLLPRGKYTRLLTLWRAAGWMLGFLPTLVGGTKALYVTVEAVETFVEQHYQQQITTLMTDPNTNHHNSQLLRLLQHCCEEEVHHKRDAAEMLLGPVKNEFHAWWVQPWSIVVKAGSAAAAHVARRI